MVDAARQPSGDGAREWDLEVMVRAACAGDSEAWTKLVRAYAPRVFAMVQSRTRNTTVSEDITQAVLATVAIQLRSGGYSEAGRFESWLFRIAMNRVRDHARMQRRRGPSVPLEHAPVPVATAAEMEDGPPLARALAEALETLGEADREVIELRHHAGLGFRDIAQLLDEPLGTLLARHHRALAKLRATLERTHPALVRLFMGGGEDDPPDKGGAARPAVPTGSSGPTGSSSPRSRRTHAEESHGMQ